MIVEQKNLYQQCCYSNRTSYNKRIIWRIKFYFDIHWINIIIIHVNYQYNKYYCQNVTSFTLLTLLGKIKNKLSDILKFNLTLNLSLRLLKSEVDVLI